MKPVGYKPDSTEVAGGGASDYTSTGHGPTGRDPGVMVDPFVLAFVALLAGYVVYSLWVRLDPRWPIAAALVILVVAAVADAAQDLGTANLLAEFVVLLLGAGVLLLLVEHARDARATAHTSGTLTRDPESTDLAEERDRSAQQPLDRPEQEPVALVDAPGQEHHDEEQAGDPEADHGEAP
jgi:hypothetical protein